MGNLQDRHANIDQKPTEVQLLHAAEFGDKERLERILTEHYINKPINQDGEVDIDTAKFCLWTPLFLAAKQGNFECVKILLDAGARVNGINKDKSAWTPLWVATFAGHDECVKLLLDAGANFEVKNPETPLFVAAREGRVNCLRMLIDAGASVNITFKKRQTALHAAIIANKVECIKLMVQAGADLEARNNDGATPLLNACVYSEVDCIKILLQNGANIFACATSHLFEGYTAMHICASKSKLLCLKVLYEFGASLNSATTKDKMRPRDLAVNNCCRDYLIQMEGTVRSLKDICRLKVRRLVGHAKLKELFDEVSLPISLMKYLKYEDD